MGATYSAIMSGYQNPTLDGLNARYEVTAEINRYIDGELERIQSELEKINTVRQHAGKPRVVMMTTGDVAETISVDSSDEDDAQSSSAVPVSKQESIRSPESNSVPESIGESSSSPMRPMPQPQPQPPRGLNLPRREPTAAPIEIPDSIEQELEKIRMNRRQPPAVPPMAPMPQMPMPQMQMAEPQRPVAIPPPQQMPQQPAAQAQPAPPAAQPAPPAAQPHVDLEKPLQ